MLEIQFQEKNTNQPIQFVYNKADKSCMVRLWNATATKISHVRTLTDFFNTAYLYIDQQVSHAEWLVLRESIAQKIKKEKEDYFYISGREIKESRVDYA